MAQEVLLRPAVVAQILGVSRSTVYRWFWEGVLKGIKIASGTVRIYQSSVSERLAHGD